MRSGVASARQGGLGQRPKPLHRPADPQGKDEQDHETEGEASPDARRSVGSHDLAVRLARRWQSPPEVSQAVLGGPADPVPSGMSRTSFFTG